jgi:hypothetical protein
VFWKGKKYKSHIDYDITSKNDAKKLAFFPKTTPKS